MSKSGKTKLLHNGKWKEVKGVVFSMSDLLSSGELCSRIEVLEELSPSPEDGNPIREKIRS